jgi:hypothetical protein
MLTFEMGLGKHKINTDFECVGVCFIGMQRINVTTKYPPQWHVAIRYGQG